MFRTILLLLMLASATAGSAAAQSCLGLPSFAAGPVHLNAGGQFPDSATSYALAVTGGTQGGLFGTVGVGAVQYTGISSDARLGLLEFGVERALGPLRICPIVGGYLGIGPDQPDVDLTVTSQSAAAALAVGMPLGSHTLRFVPNAAVRYQYTAQHVEQEGIGEASDRFNDLLLDLGVGLVFFDRFSVQPTAQLPLRAEGLENSYGVSLSASFGRARR